MGAKLVIRVSPDERVQVKIEGMDELDREKPKGAKLCERVTRRLEKDLGLVDDRTYPGEELEAIEVRTDEDLRVDGSLSN